MNWIRMNVAAYNMSLMNFKWSSPVIEKPDLVNELWMIYVAGVIMHGLMDAELHI